MNVNQPHRASFQRNIWQYLVISPIGVASVEVTCYSCLSNSPNLQQKPAAGDLTK